MGAAKKSIGSVVGGKSAGDRLGGAAKGAVAGFMAGGPVGAVIGGVGGAAVGSSGISKGISSATKGLSPAEIQAQQINPSSVGGGDLDTIGAASKAKNDALGKAIAASQAQRSGLKTPQGTAVNVNRAGIQNVASQNVGPGQAVSMDTSGVQRVGAQTGAQLDRSTIQDAQALASERAALTQIQTADQAQMRQQQLALGEQLAAQASGQAPSIAEMQAKRQGDRALAAQMAMQAGQAGSATPLAQRTAARQQAQIGAEIAAQSAELRLQEQQAAQKALGDLSGSVRGQDISLAAQQAQLEQSTNIANLQASQGDVDRALKAQMANQAADITAAQSNLQAQMADMDRQLRSDLANQGVDLDKAKMDAANGNAMALANLSTATQNADRLLKANMANQGVDLDVMKANAAAGNAMAQANLVAQVQKMGLDDAMTRAYLQNQLDLNAQQTNQVMDTMKIKSQESIAQAGLNQQAAMANSAAKNAQMGGLMSAGATLGAAYITASDENLKTNITPDANDEEKKKKEKRDREAMAKAIKDAGQDASGSSSPKDEKRIPSPYESQAKVGEALIKKNAEDNKAKAENDKATAMSDEDSKKSVVKQSGRLQELLQNLDVYSYDYKNKKFGEGKQTSVMAQDLEKSDIGKKAVMETPEGKMVDYSKLMPAMLAANVDANKRIMKLEDALMAKKGKK